MTVAAESPTAEAPPPAPGPAAAPGRIWVGFAVLVAGIVLGITFGNIATLIAVGIALVLGIRLVGRHRVWPGVVLIALATLALPVLLLCAKLYKIPSESMAPTVARGDHVIVNTLASPDVGDIVVFHPPAPAVDAVGGRGPSGQCGVDNGGRTPCPAAVPREASDVEFIKRVVAGPGDSVAIRDGRAVVNGRVLQEGYITPCATGDDCSFPQAVTVPKDHWFLLGDNRGRSDDSRYWGPVPSDWIIGVVYATTWPPGSLALR